MFVTTFYSFKGGVGRTMALMNVACELAKTKKVLIVDFDLEAPGISTFPACRAAHGKSGLVEFLISYQSNEVAPPVEDYIVECDLLRYDDDAGPAPETRSRLFVMPAGNMQAAYGSKFGQIDWNDLYENRDGYLLMEDLKAQWRSMDFDYVFIDSRTGHTDSGGICTRQLPDALVAVFGPNEQNLLGMQMILNEVRNDAETRNVDREYIFVASRVPLLDDEHNTLDSMLKRFKSSLKYSDENFTRIHNYDSLALIDQDVFVCSRPRTRLATEYKNLARLIQGRNVFDKDGASIFLENTLRRRDLPEARDIDMLKLEQIGKSHKDSADIMHDVALVYYVRRELEFAAVAIDAANASLVLHSDDDLVPARVLGLRIRIYRALNETAEAAESALACLQLKRAPRVVLVDALRTILELEPDRLPEPEQVPVFRSMNVQALQEAAIGLNFSRQASQYGAKIVLFASTSTAAASIDDGEPEAWLVLIAGGEFSEALNRLSARASKDERFRTSLIYLFNFAMADWGANRKPNPALFDRVRKRYDLAGEPDHPTRSAANFHQCMAVTFAILGDDRATDALTEAVRQIRLFLTAFSCWSYQPANRATFENHCAMIRRLIGGQKEQPLFITENAPAAVH